LLAFVSIVQTDRWLGIELRHLAALEAIAEERSFHAAAARLGYSQSAVSQQIATLERIVGGKLIERPGGPRTVFLTALGELVLRHAEAIVARLQAARADADAMVAGDVGTLRVGTYQSVGEQILPALVPRFHAARPGVEITLIESESDDELLAHVERGELDLAFALLPLPDGPFAFVELMDDPWMALVPADGPLADRGGPLPLRDVASWPLIGARLPRCRMQVDAEFRAHGLDPRYVFRSDENGTVHGLVAAGLGIGIVPRLAFNGNDERVVALELGPDVTPRVIVLAWHRDRHRSAAAEALVELAGQLCAELQRRSGVLVDAVAPGDRE
jgi:DNA-binding transcriptional LysR family regulator